MELYIGRSLRYLLKMVVIIAVLVALMNLTGTLRIAPGWTMQELLASRPMQLLGAVLLAAAAIYPRLAFSTVRLRIDMDSNRKAIIDAFASNGYKLVKNEESSMEFRAEKIWRRLDLQFDDRITVTGDDEGILIEGMGKEVGRAESRITVLINQNENNEDEQ